MGYFGWWLVAGMIAVAGTNGEEQGIRTSGHQGVSATETSLVD